MTKLAGRNATITIDGKPLQFSSWEVDVSKLDFGHSILKNFNSVFEMQKSLVMEGYCVPHHYPKTYSRVMADRKRRLKKKWKRYQHQKRKQ